MSISPFFVYVFAACLPSVNFYLSSLEKVFDQYSYIMSLYISSFKIVLLFLGLHSYFSSILLLQHQENIFHLLFCFLHILQMRSPWLFLILVLYHLLDSHDLAVLLLRCSFHILLNLWQIV